MFLGTSRRCSLHGSSAVFLGKGARQSHTCCINPAQHVVAQSCSIIWESSYSLCLFWFALRAQSTVTGIHFGLNFPHTPSESSAEPGCLSFSLIYYSSVRSWKETCQFLLCAAQWPSETLSPLSISFSKELRKRAQSQGLVLQRVTLLDDLLSLMQKGRQSIPFPFFPPS